jgi:fatty acid amide hydrolase 2
VSTPILTSSATTLARAIRERELSAREVVDAHIALLERTARSVNAIAADRYAAAREEAAAADALIAAGKQDVPPLLGVPFTVKESIHVAGMPNCAGLVARRDHRSERSAPIVERLVDAGAIPLGVTNTSELTMWIESFNRVYGRTRNPYDYERVAGGSSGGEGAAVGSGGSPFGIGSDIGGSIRIPAFYCGVFGHKPSPGLVPLTGCFPAPQHELSASMLANGPLARRAEDLMPVLRLMSGPDPGDPQTASAPPLGDPLDVSLAGMRVLVSDAAFLQPISRELRDARERAAGALAAAGAHVEHVQMRELRLTTEAFLAKLTDCGKGGLADLFVEAGLPAVTKRDILRPGGPHTLALKLLILTEMRTPKFLMRRAPRVLAWADRLERELAETIGDGALLHPPLARVAPRHGRTVGRPLVVHPMAVFNLLRVPVTEVPLGLGSEGVPLGVQVVAAPGNDHVSIAVALELERVFGGWVPPMGVGAGAARPREPVLA